MVGIDIAFLEFVDHDDDDGDDDEDDEDGDEDDDEDDGWMDGWMENRYLTYIRTLFVSFKEEALMEMDGLVGWVGMDM